MQLVGLFGMGALNCIVSVVLLRMQVKFVMGGMDVEATPLGRSPMLPNSSSPLADGGKQCCGMCYG